MGTERIAIDSAERWVTDMQRRSMQQERRREIHTASDLLGPGFGPTATRVLDWNAEETAFNGYFWSPIGAINSPDGTLEWCGICVVEDDALYGVQTAWSPQVGDPPKQYRRRFSNLGGTSASRIFTPWRGSGDWKTTGITATGGFGAVTQQAWRRENTTVSFTILFTFNQTISVQVDGNVADTTLCQLPAEITPVDEPMQQYVHLGGRAGSVHVTATGLVILAAASAGVVISNGTQLFMGGTFLL